MLIFFYGQDSFRINEKLLEMKAKFTREVDKSALNILCLEGNKVNLPKLKESFYSSGFLAPKKMIVVTNLLGENKGKKILDEILALLSKNPPKENIVVFREIIEGNKKLSGALFKFLTKQKYAQEFKKLKEPEVLDWVRKRAILRGFKIDSRAVSGLSQICENNIWTISGELEKLFAYCDENKIITLGDVALLSSGEENINIFKVVDSFFSGDKKQFQILTHKFLESGGEPEFLMNMILRNIRLLIRARGKLVKNPAANISRELKIHPFQAQKLRSQVKSFQKNRLKQIHSRLAEMDLKIKQRYFDIELLFRL